MSLIKRLPKILFVLFLFIIFITPVLLIVSTYREPIIGSYLRNKYDKSQEISGFLSNDEMSELVWDKIKELNLLDSYIGYVTIGNFYSHDFTENTVLVTIRHTPVSNLVSKEITINCSSDSYYFSRKGEVKKLTEAYEDIAEASIPLTLYSSCGQNEECTKGPITESCFIYE